MDVMVMGFEMVMGEGLEPDVSKIMVPRTGTAFVAWARVG
jgi:hypothetical protein